MNTLAVRPLTTVFATRTAKMQENAVREILKVVNRPGMVSLAGGIPAPESFPLDLMPTLLEVVLRNHGSTALQYDATEGFAPLRAALVAYLAEKGVASTADEVLVFSGSQGVLDALGKILISPGDKVAVEAPTYLGALSAFNPYEPTYVQIATDAAGLLPDALEAALRTESIKFLYLVPTFQNPTGRTLSIERRQAIAALLQEYGVLLVEDDPYRDLRYRGEALPPIKQFAPEHVVYVSTLSKTFAPGLRIGFCVAPTVVHRWLVITKQGVDLHTSTLNQALAAEYLAGGYLQQQLPKILAIYAPRQQAMLAALDRHLPEGFQWTQPDGGMFLWLEGPETLDTEKAYWRAIEQNVAFVPGKFFFAEPNTGRNTMRLNFTMSDEPTIDRAVATLAQVLAG
ncbi:MAG TPA: PLP-dependent aminotransferase family protein [Caldilineaceae bacterium]|nr:PLP-dependent aminotransferase family protein [Caldilineaceae bacterium]